MAMETSKASVLLVFVISTSLLALAFAGKDQEQQQTNSLRSKLEININKTIPSVKDVLSLFEQIKSQQTKKRFHAREYLDAHNKVRLQHNEPPFVWDRGLARYARRFANQRINDCEMVHSPSKEYGENIFWGGANTFTPADVVKEWVSEIQFYDKARNSCPKGKMCGHYTQIVWRDSFRLGCAQVDCANGGMYAICSYDPPGNYIGEGPF